MTRVLSLCALLALACTRPPSVETALHQSTDGQLPRTATASDSARFWRALLLQHMQLVREVTRENAELRAHAPMMQLGRLEDENNWLRTRCGLPTRPES